MPRTASTQPTEGELNILRILWARGPSRLSAICEILGQEREVAPTTVATMLKIMKGKGQVKRTASSSGVVWKATLTKAEAGNNILKHVMNRLFDGSAQKLVIHLLERGSLSEADQREIQRLLETKRNPPNH